MITVITIYIKYYVKQAMEACYFVASSEGSQPTLIWRPTHHSEATASAKNAINFPAVAAADDDYDSGGCGHADGNDLKKKRSPVLTVFLSPKIQVQ